jgi:hypothetical protein
VAAGPVPVPSRPPRSSCRSRWAATTPRHASSRWCIRPGAVDAPPGDPRRRRHRRPGGRLGSVRRPIAPPDLHSSEPPDPNKLPHLAAPLVAHAGHQLRWSWWRRHPARRPCLPLPPTSQPTVRITNSGWSTWQEQLDAAGSEAWTTSWAWVIGVLALLGKEPRRNVCCWLSKHLLGGQTWPTGCWSSAWTARWWTPTRWTLSEPLNNGSRLLNARRSTTRSKSTEGARPEERRTTGVELAADGDSGAARPVMAIGRVQPQAARHPRRGGHHAA